MNITQLADISFRELNSPNDESLPSIAFFYENNLGQLNNLLSTTFTIDINGIVSPEFTDAQAVIYKYIFIINYFNRQIQKNLGAGAYAATVLEIKEGGRNIKMVDKTNIAKQLLALIASIKDQLNDNLYAYNSNNALPYSIDVTNPIIQESLFAFNNIGRWWKARV